MPIVRKVTKAGTVRYYVTTRHEGKKVYHPGGYAKRRDAEAALARLKVAKDERTYHPPGQTTTGDYLMRWVASHKQLRDRTRQRYEQVLRDDVVPVIGDVRLDRLRPEDVSGSSTTRKGVACRWRRSRRCIASCMPGCAWPWRGGR